MELKNLASACKQALDKIDREQLEKRFPGPDKAKKYHELRKRVVDLSAAIDATKSKGISDELLTEMEKISIALETLLGELHPTTELYGKSSVNAIISWAEAGYVERSIYFAGLSYGKRVREPYNTQIQMLPVNACLSRFRQCTTIWDALNRRDPDGEQRALLALLDQMRASYLYQMKHFSERAFERYPDHPLTPYGNMLVQLLQADEFERAGKVNLMEHSITTARSFLDKIPEPKRQMHRAYSQYYILNCREFESSPSLRSKYNEFWVILDRHRRIALELADEGDLHTPLDHYTIIPYVIVGARASLVTIAAGISLVGHLPFHEFQTWMHHIWANAAAGIPGITTADATLIAHHGGVIDFLTQFAHTGGVIDF